MHWNALKSLALVRLASFPIQAFVHSVGLTYNEAVGSLGLSSLFAFVFSIIRFYDSYKFYTTQPSPWYNSVYYNNLQLESALNMAVNSLCDISLMRKTYCPQLTLLSTKGWKSVSFALQIHGSWLAVVQAPTHKQWTDTPQVQHPSSACTFFACCGIQ